MYLILFYSGVLSKASKHKSLMVINKRFPDVYRRIIFGTTYHLLYKDRDMMTDQMINHRAHYYSSETKLKVVRDNNFTYSRAYSTIEKLLCGVFGCLILKVGNKLLRRLIENICFRISNMKAILQVCSVQSFTDFFLLLSTSGTNLVAAAQGNLSLIELLNVICEEIIRFFSPLFSVGLFWGEFFVYIGMLRKQGGVLSKAILVRLVPLILHWTASVAIYKKKTMKMFCFITSIHIAYNMLSKRYNKKICDFVGIKIPIVGGRPIYERFIENYKNFQQDQVYTMGWTVLKQDDIILPTSVPKLDISKSDLSNFSVKVDGVEKDVLEVFETLPDTTAGCIYPVCISNGTMYRPANNMKGIMTAAVRRICLIPRYLGGFKEGDLGWDSLHEWWRAVNAMREMEPFYLKPIDRIDTLEDAVKKMGKKKHRILNANEDLINLGRHSKGKRINVKSNETISNPFKPRAITDLPPEEHAQMTQYAHVLADSYKASWNINNVYSVNDYNVRFVYASGMNSEELSEVGRLMVESGDIIFVFSGDDAFASFGKYAEHFDMKRFVDWDIKKCDQSHSEGSMDCTRFMHGDADVPGEITDLAMEEVTRPIQFVKDRIEITCKPKFQLPTGIVWTTTTNGGINFGAFVYFLNHCQFDLHQAYARLGFEIEMNQHDDIHGGTFLKGWYPLDCDNVVYWEPLPSCILKLGKTMTDPVLATRVVRDGSTYRLPWAQAIKRAAAAIADSQMMVSRQTPIVGPFLQILDRLGEKNNREVVLSESIYNKPTVVVKHEPLLPLYYRMLYQRYEITTYEINSFAMLMNDITALPVYYEHPLISKLLIIDYGLVEVVL